MLNPKSLKNLKQFKKGDPPKHVKSVGDVSLVAALKAYLKEHPEEIKSLVASWIKQAHENPTALKELIERLDGKVSQPVTGAGGGPVEIIVRYDGNRNEVSSATE